MVYLPIHHSFYVFHLYQREQDHHLQATTVDLKKLKRQLTKIDKQRDQEKINKERISKGLRPILSTEDIRDNTISILKNSGVSDELVHARNGPTPLTLARWRAKGA